MRNIEVYEVGPRDGFQNLDQYIPIETKVSIIEKLVQSGVQNIQHTSFVSPRAIPQLKDSRELTEICLSKFPGINFSALVPNLKGASLANEAGVCSISYVVSLSQSHNKANINRTHEESFNEIVKIRDTYPELKICLDLSTTFGCPFEMKENNNRVVEFLEDYIKLGIKEVNLCDTIGVANPHDVKKTINDVKSAYPDLNLQIHIHDTRNMGMINTFTAIQQGVTKIQSTLGGLGGCPFAPGASGNLATEDIVYMLNDMNYNTGIDFSLLLQAAKFQKQVVNGNFSGHLQFI
ncbi:hydroxymethylglutaryl-CoA lyase [Ureibacillus aquaedulcis]|uniref:Hydroxymethylglutaryl-CoA lyase n=1 Tax=Ureibacillus aquaedulcis TaxID=3058421 RepID=A0ABT8GVZ4_9BACL|nr:hydroxymethylglutaryl-CoA lyase [Ureibacillus sp. BA0131]MDN4495590.1 hydroxymethylglutaryl-CoA lyase [Ureibacillus sp. BA0131]